MGKVIMRNRLSDIPVTKIELGDGKIQHHKMVIGPYGELSIVDADLEDIDKKIQSNKDNAGAFNYIRQEMANGKSFDEIIAQGNIALQKQLFADVGDLSSDMTPSEVEARINDGVGSIIQVAQTLGTTPEELLKMKPEVLKALINKVAEDVIATNNIQVAEGE